MEVKEGKAYKYAEWCITETEGKVPQYVKKQAESWLHIADGEDPDAVVDENAYEKICRLLKIMNHPNLHCPIYEAMETVGRETFCSCAISEPRTIPLRHCKMYMVFK